MQYFDIHIVENEDTELGYSVFLKTNKKINSKNHNEIIKEAIQQNLFDLEESQFINNITEIDETEFLLATK